MQEDINYCDNDSLNTENESERFSNVYNKNEIIKNNTSDNVKTKNTSEHFFVHVSNDHESLKDSSVVQLPDQNDCSSDTTTEEIEMKDCGFETDGVAKEDLTNYIFNRKSGNISSNSANSSCEKKNVNYYEKNFMPLSFKLDEEHSLKIIIVGDYSVGKTAIVQQYINNEFSSKYKVTIGMEYGMKQFRWDDLTIVKVHLWDIAGQERTGTITRQFYKNSHAIILVCDASRYKSFLAIPQWIENLKRHVLQSDGSTVPIILFVNKCDLPIQKLNIEQLNRTCCTHGMDAWYLTSAKNNTNIEDAMRFVIRRALEVKKKADVNALLEPPEEENAIELIDEKKNKKSTRFKKCCRTN